jgi:hypothetical protein
MQPLTGFFVRDEVQVIGDHDLAGLRGTIVEWDTNFMEPVVLANGLRYVIHTDYLQVLRRPNTNE